MSNQWVADVERLAADYNGFPYSIDVLAGFPSALCYLGQYNGKHVIAGGAPNAALTKSGVVAFIHLNESLRVEDVWTLESPVKTSFFGFGYNVVPLTDLNGDGKLEIAIMATTAGNASFASAYIFSMNSNGFADPAPVMVLSPVEEPLNQFPPFSDEAYSKEWRESIRFAMDVAFSGDLDGDGVGDIVLASPESPTNFAGEIYLVFMNADLSVKDVKTLSACNDCLEPPSVGREVDLADAIPDFVRGFGTSITALGDLDGDAVPDIAVSGWGAHTLVGAVYILFLNRNGTVKAVQEISAIAGESGLGVNSTDSFGWIVRNTGNEAALTETERFGPDMDFNHDNVPDLLVTSGGPSYSSWLLYLERNGTVKGIVNLGESLRGSDIAPVTDLNGDDIPDFIVNSPSYYFYDDGAAEIWFMGSISVNVSAAEFTPPDMKRQTTSTAAFVVQVSSVPVEDIVVRFSVDCTAGINRTELIVSVPSPMLFTRNTSTAVTVEVYFQYPESSKQEEGIRLVLEQPTGGFLQHGQGTSFLIVRAAIVDTPSDSLESSSQGEDSFKQEGDQDQVGAEVIAPVVVCGVLLLLLVVALVVMVRVRRARKKVASEARILEEGKSEYQAASPLSTKKNDERRRSADGSDETQNWFIDQDELEFEKEIGQGAFGVVWKGRWRRTEVAIKKLHTMDDTQLLSFQHEAQLMRTLRPHPNVVQLMGLVEKDGLPECIVTEFLANGDLLTFLRKQEGLPAEQMIAMAFDVAAGMAHLHAEGITHRDLAARNLLITEDMKIKVADFGLSRQLTLAGAEQKTKNEVGPLKWMSPEAIQQSIYSEKSDVWSYGVCLWEIVTLGQEPFAQAHILKAAVKICKDGCKSLCIPKQTPAVLKEVMLSCWQMDPKDRPTFDEITTLFQSHSA
ncbi:Receptor tyrosine-protein kinase erbB-2 [Balamuthia mandrillaris]